MQKKKMNTSMAVKKSAAKKRVIAKQDAAVVEVAAASGFNPGDSGADYHQIDGAKCPRCRMGPASVRNTMPWADGLRERYHICRRCGNTFKSIEVLRGPK